MTTGADFRVVIAAAKRGDERALGQLYRTCNAGIVRYLSLNAQEAGEDLAQEVWLGAAANLSRFDGDERQFRTWLFTIARRRLIDHWRTVGRQPAGLTVHDVVSKSGDEPHAHVDSLAAIGELIQGLTPVEREIVVLRIVADLSAEEVAAIVGRTAGAVRVIQHRAIKKAAARLKGPTLPVEPSRVVP